MSDMSDEKCVILSGRGIGFIEIPRVEHTSKKINTSKPPDDVYNKIKEIAVKDFPYNYEVQRHTIDMEVDAYHEFVSLSFEGVAENDKLLILKESRKSDSWMYKVSVARAALRCLKEISELSQYIGQDKVEYIRRKVRKEYKNKNFIIQLSLVLDACRDIKKENEIESVKNILIDMENIIGNSCYNGNIQNYGSGGVWEGEGRHFRYPVTFEKSDKKWKVSPEISAKKLMSGHYAFGANQLSIYSALYKIIKYLEKEHGVILKDKK